MRGIILMLVVLSVVILIFHIGKVLNSVETNNVVMSQQVIYDTKVMTFYKLLVDSDYLDIVTRMMEFDYSTSNSSEFFKDYVRLIYLNRLLTNVSREMNIRAKVYVNGTLVFDSEEFDTKYVKPRLDLNESNMHIFLQSDEVFYTFPYISPSLRYYKVVIVVGS